MRRMIATVLTACLAGCGGGARPAPPGRAAAVAPTAGPAPRAPAPPSRCVPAPHGDLAAPGPFAVRRRALQATRRSSITRARRQIDPVAWFPARNRACAAPLVLVSHGHFGAPVACEWLCSRLAGRGFVVVAVRHADRGTPPRLQAIERIDDLSYVLDHLARFAPTPVDRHRIGVAGHSFGGRTAVELAAEDARVDAVVTMAGGADRATTATVTAPTLMLAGGADTIDPPELSIRSARALPRTTPHRVIVVPGTGHTALGSVPASVRAATGWLLAYLAGRK
jgi:predicted dienelactone hydrolase